MSEKLVGSCIFGQSGGPTSVINASAYGVIKTALEAEVVFFSDPNYITAYEQH